jgi:NAD(P)-dependent dehydrogenase (short-subunit alcohol dehydrogenase family)
MQVDLRNHIALVTGAARGIGRSIAGALAKNGAAIAVNDIADGQDTCCEIRQAGGSAEFVAPISLTQHR